MSTISRPANWKSLAPYPPPATPTFEHQHTLPQLPLPNLASTLAKLKTSLKPIAYSDAEYKEVERKIDELGASGGIGELLQSRLEERKRKKVHWLEEWWDNLAYMDYRDSVVVNVSYYYGFTPHPPHLDQSQAARAAALTRAALLFRKQLKNGLLPPDRTKEGALCMDTWRWMFDCCRIPSTPDFAVSHGSEDPTGSGGTVIAIHKNRFWKIEVGFKDGLLSTSELEKAFQHIINSSSSEIASSHPEVGILTSWNRDSWTTAYNSLCESPTNLSIINDVNRSAFVVCLDTSSPSSIIPFSRALWHGGLPASSTSSPAESSSFELGNRWCDKPLQFIIFGNGQAGVMGEHSIMDGTPVTRMCDEILDALQSPTFDHASPSITQSASPTALDWEISPTIRDAISAARKDAEALVSSQAMSYLTTQYGKDLIKTFSVSPDSWAQLIIQLAYSRLFPPNKRLGGTYEAATTRRFLKGRTETIRVITSESDAFCAAMNDPNKTNEERKSLLYKAASTHIALAKEAGNGEGVDRHMLGLKLSLQSSELAPALFSDPVYQRSSKWVLSTSAIWSKHFPSYGWGEVVDDGFGVAYMTGYSDKLQYTITSRTHMPNSQFAEEIEKASEDMRLLFEPGKEGRPRL